MTKKQFNQESRHQTFIGTGIKVNALYFDWKSGEVDGKFYQGYKFMVYANNKKVSLKELRDALYNWVTKEIQPPYTVHYKYAESLEKRFKMPLSIACN